MINSVRDWFERVLERPFYEAEMFRADILKGNEKKNNVIRTKKFGVRLKQV